MVAGIIDLGVTCFYAGEGADSAPFVGRVVQLTVADQKFLQTERVPWNL